jgi:hypothetical protein
VEDRDKGITGIVTRIYKTLLAVDYIDAKQFIEEFKSFPQLDCTSSVEYLLNYICAKLEKPLIIYFDEVDCVSEEPLITFLRQSRSGYINRYDQKEKLSFPSSITLIGMRDIRDYLTKNRPESKSKQLASPFNI